jgi:hypothetical protein
MADVWSEMKRQQRERHQQLMVVEQATVPALPRGAPEPSPALHLGRLALVSAAFGMFVVGLAINGWYGRSLGSTEVSGWLFLAVGIVSDIAAFVLPTWALHLRPMLAAVAWALAFALLASVGFASLNIADTTTARSWRSPAVEAEQRALEDARLVRDWECRRGVGPICRQRQDGMVVRQRKLDEARLAVVADPQIYGASKLIAWITLGRVAPSADDLAMLRLSLLTLLPQLGGLLLMVARR